ncbi:unnamed protein product [Adineta steineri]|uniref:Uncharacterized protein n=1 Tax=Adineta steineri TaxID=433720 RepID=A0A813ZUF0_9BILA|nr:unnamed protein product [Adineta steineri]
MFIIAFISSRESNAGETDDEQPKNIRTWASSMGSNQNSQNYLSTNSNLLSVDEIPEERAWSSGLNTQSDDYLSEGPTREQRLLLSKTNKTNQNSVRRDPRGVEQILSYIDQRRPPRKRHVYRLTWRTFIGTMSGMNEIYNREEFHKYRFLIIFLDSVFRGISQVMFANNPLSGLIITIGLFYGDWQLAFYGLLGTSVSTLTAHILGYNYNAIRSGLYGYNGCLTGMGIAYFTFPQSPQIIPAVILMSIFSSIFTMSIGKVLVEKFEISPYTFSFQISTWIWLLGSLKYRYFFLDGQILSPSLLTTFTDKPNLLNISYQTYTVEDNFVGFFASIAQVYFLDNPYTGAIILIGVSLCSRILSFFALFGAVTSQLAAAYLLGLSPQAIHSGLWGYNAVLTCEALGGMFFVLYGYKIWIFTLYGSLMTLLVQACISSFLNPVGMPTLTFPFTFICWIFCLSSGSKNLVPVKITSVSIPEDHYRRYRTSQLIKSQFYFLSHLTTFSFSADENLTWGELAKIKEEFIPILMCSYVYKNDLHSLKMLFKQTTSSKSTDQYYRSPLHISSCQGNFLITKYLIEHGKLDANAEDKYGNSPLFDALWNGQFHLLAYLYYHGARLPGDKAQELAFYLNAFVYEDNLDAIQCLISCGLNPNNGDYDGRNALHSAIITNQFNIVCFLVEKTQIWFDLTDHSQKTPLNYLTNLSDFKIKNYLFDKIQNNYNPLKISSEKLPTFSKKSVHAKEDKDEKTIPTNIDEILFPSLFWIISAQNDKNKIKNFLEQFSHLNILDCVDYDYRSVLHVAAADGNLEVIQFLAEISSKEHFQQILLREDRWGFAPLDYACQNDHFHISQFLNEYMDNNISPPTIIQLDNQNQIVNLFKKWFKIHLFQRLASSGQAQRIQGLFIQNYFHPNQLYADYHQRTPMHIAAANGHLNVVQILLQYGYDGITQKDRWGFYPIDEARKNHFYEVVNKLQQNTL